MRPRGEIRAALMSAAHGLAHEVRAGFTYLDLATRSRVGFDAARSTTKDMVKAGELRPVGTRQVPGIRRPLRTYELAKAPAVRHADHAKALSGAMRAWAAPN